jgi:glycosidase
MFKKLTFPLLILTLATACHSDDDQPSPNQGYQQYATPFDAIPEIEDIVMYEVNLRAFGPDGDLQSVISQLDHIASLGINVIWLMPIHPIGQINSVNSPYSVQDYKLIGSEYGTLEDLRTLTDEAHARGMAVIMDWVANHTAWDNPWIENQDWYTQNSNGEIVHPPGTNWLDVADLNYDNVDMRAAMIDAMQYWVYNANIDGFRCDYADGVPYNFWHEAIQSLDSIPNHDLIFFAEGTRSTHFTAGFDLNFGWQSYSAIKEVFEGDDASKILETSEDVYNSTPAGKHWIRFTTNHDESAWDATPISLFNGIEGALAASVASIFTGGVPLIYGSQEVGTSNTIPFFSNANINWSANPEMLSQYQTMLQYYSAHKVARTGENTMYSDPDVVCLKKSLEENEVLILINVRNATMEFNIPEELQNTSWINIMTQEEVSFSDKITLAPYEYYILD